MKESFGLTLLEAMKTGVVPIGSNAGGIKEVIKHDETGFIVDIGDSTSASEYALQLLSNKEYIIKCKMLILTNDLVQN